MLGNRLLTALGATVLVAGSMSGALVGTATPAGAATVSDEASFTTAWQTAGTTEIDLSANVTLTCTSGEPTRNSATAIMVNGNGHTLSQTCAGDRVAEQQSSGAITFSDITVTGGTGTGSGGAVDTQGDLTITSSTFTGNTASGEGGAIEAEGAVTISGSAVTDNTSTGSGGGMAASGLVTLTDSTFSGNHSGNNGGGMRAYGGADVVNSTISDNVAVGGGGIDSNQQITLTYATVTGNTGEANLYVGDSQLTSFGSVIADPVSGPNCIQLSSTDSKGYNVDDDGTCGFGSGPGDHSDLASIGLGALAANGGLGQTQLPASTSPLVDQIPKASCGAGSGITTDERGVTRPQGSACDIGAVELSVAGPTTTTTAPASSTASAAAAAVAATPQFTG